MDAEPNSLMHMAVLNPANPAPVICRKENSLAYPQLRSNLRFDTPR
jgi:hypothetical protein